MILEFRECNTCKEKLGSPELCKGCLYNRDVINAFKAQVASHYRRMINLRRIIDEFHSELED